VISLGDENNPRVLIQIPNLSMDERRSLQRNILVIRNGVETYSGIRYQFADGTEYSFPYPLTTEETPVPADSMKTYGKTNSRKPQSCFAKIINPFRFERL